MVQSGSVLVDSFMSVIFTPVVLFAEKDRLRERKSDRGTDTEREKDRVTDTEGEKHRQRDRHRDRQARKQAGRRTESGI